MNTLYDIDQIYRAMGFHCPPFRITPDTSFFFPHSQYLTALGRLRFGASSGGLTVLTGEVGLGKTLLCRYFLRQLAEAPEVRTAYIFNPKQSYGELLASLYRDLTGEEVQSNAASVIHDALYRRLIQLAGEGKRVIFIVDEAHALEPSLIEGLRLLTNLETEDRKLASLMLFGQTELDELLATRQLRALRERITVWHKLRPFGWVETAEYVNHRINKARESGHFCFTRAALTAVRYYTSGIPRRINILCDRALLAAFSQQKQRVDLALLRLAAREVFGRVPIN
ncbi:MAG: AAA family ATPase [Azovibrio sp.]|nr:AAA family ATPase [Azovibrio sp.]